jgi:protein TonB
VTFALARDPAFATALLLAVALHATGVVGLGYWRLAPQDLSAPQEVITVEIVDARALRAEFEPEGEPSAAAPSAIAEGVAAAPERDLGPASAAAVERAGLGEIGTGDDGPAPVTAPEPARTTTVAPAAVQDEEASATAPAPELAEARVVEAGDFGPELDRDSAVASATSDRSPDLAAEPETVAPAVATVARIDELPEVASGRARLPDPGPVAVKPDTPAAVAAPSPAVLPEPVKVAKRQVSKAVVEAGAPAKRTKAIGTGAAVKSKKAASEPAVTQTRGAAKGNGVSGRVSAGRVAIGSYQAAVRARINRNRGTSLGVRGRTLIAFGLEPGGGLRFARVSQSSGVAQLDAAALRAVQRSAPFPPAPAGATASQLSWTISITFN